MSEDKGFELRFCNSASCALAVVNTEELLPKLEKILENANLGAFYQSLGLKGKKRHRFRVAVAACPNACTQVHIADYGIIGQAVPALEGDCNTCGVCVDVCEEEAITLFEDRFPMINFEYCINCGACIRACPQDALKAESLGYKILVGGKLGRHPMLAKEVFALVSAEKAAEILDKTISFYQKHCKSGERLRVIIEKLGWDTYLAAIS